MKKLSEYLITEEQVKNWEDDDSDLPWNNKSNSKSSDVDDADFNIDDML